MRRLVCLSAMALLAAQALATLTQSTAAEHVAVTHIGAPRGGPCRVSPGTSIQEALDQASAAAGPRGSSFACELEAGIHEVVRPLLLPPGATLFGQGKERTTIRSRIAEAALDGNAPRDWPRHMPLRPGLPPDPVLAVVLARTSVISPARPWQATLADVSLDAGMSSGHREWANTHCGGGFGVDALEPGPEKCRWQQSGVAAFPANGQAGAAGLLSLVNVSIANASRGVDVVGLASLAMVRCMVSKSGYGPLVASRVADTEKVEITSSLFEGSLGSGLLLQGIKHTAVSSSMFLNNTWDGLHISASSRINLRSVTASSNMKCGVRLEAVQNLAMSQASIIHNPQTGQGGLCLSNSSNVLVEDSAIDGNGVNFAAVEPLQNVTLRSIACDVAFYHTLQGCVAPQCTTENVTCAASIGPQATAHHSATMSGSRPSSLPGPPTNHTGGRGPASLRQHPRPAVRAAGSCTVAVGEDIQSAIDTAASHGIAACHLLAGTHNVSRPIVVPSNMAVVGAGSAATRVTSRMLEPQVMLPTCGFAGGVCAVFTVNNISRENITISGLSIDGGMDEAFVANAMVHCGEAHHNYAGDPCPSCGSAPGDEYAKCGWNNFGILLWDYHEGGEVRNIHLSDLHITGCSMGLHALGVTNITLEHSVLEYNGNGNGYFHNAYFLRIVTSVIRNTTFHGSRGHGLKITNQNDTLIEDCRVTNNRWQGIWVGSESKSFNFGLRLHGCHFEGNHMYGVQLSATRGFEVINSTFTGHPNPNKAGVGVLSSADGVVAASVLTSNAVNLRLHDVRNVSLRDVDCLGSFLLNGTLCTDNAKYDVDNVSCSNSAAPENGCGLRPVL